MHWHITALVAQYGYALVGVAVGLESIGVPMPGETVLIAAALYAGTTGHLDITLIVLAAVVGGTLGNTLGFLVGQRLGAPLLERYGGRIGLDRRRLLLGQYLFRHYGGLVVAAGRFTPLLRAFAAILAGANRMPFGKFLVWSAVGAGLWATLIGFGAHALGHEVKHLAGPVGAVLALAAVLLTVGGVLLMRRHENRWLDRAEQDAANWEHRHPPRHRHP